MSDLHALSLDEAARRLGFADRTAIWRMEQRGEIAVVRLGRRKAVVPSSEITRLLTPAKEPVPLRVRKIKLARRA